MNLRQVIHDTDNGEGFAEFILVDGKPSWTGNSSSDQGKQAKKKKKKLVIFASNMNVRQFSVLFYRRFRQKNRRNSVCDEFPSSMNSAILG